MHGRGWSPRLEAVPPAPQRLVMGLVVYAVCTCSIMCLPKRACRSRFENFPGEKIRSPLQMGAACFPEGIGLMWVETTLARGLDSRYSITIHSDSNFSSLGLDTFTSIKSKSTE